MKPFQILSPGNLRKPLLPVAVFCVLSLSIGLAQNGAKIEAQSASSLDDSNTAVSTPAVTPPVGLNSGFSGKSTISRVNTVPSATNRGKVTARETPQTPQPVPGQPVTATQKVAPNQEVVDPNRMKRMAELRRELNISDASAKATLGLPADDLFLPEANTTINRLSEPVLKKVTEYLELSEKKNVTVKGYYVAGDSNKELAWARSLSLIEWMTGNSGLSIENFKAAGPLPETRPTPKKNSNELGEMEFVNRIELHLE